ncbi:hypothetical protein CH35J_009011, partial [Colletotrichum higginsianum]
CVDVLRQACGIATYQKIPDARKGLKKDDTPEEKGTTQEQPRTLAMMRRGSNQKLTRKINEQLDEMLQAGQLEEVRRPALQGLVAPGGKIEITTLNQVAANNPRDPRTWTPQQRKAYEHVASDHPEGPDGLDYDSEETPDYRITPKYQIINPKSDNHHEDHEDLFWAECLDDNCRRHKKGKKEFYFYPRRYTKEPIQDVYLNKQLPFWTMRYYGEGNIATFTPDPEYPMSCYNDDKGWRECEHDECLIHSKAKAKAWRKAQKEAQQSKN